MLIDVLPHQWFMFWLRCLMSIRFVNRLYYQCLSWESDGVYCLSRYCLLSWFQFSLSLALFFFFIVFPCVAYAMMYFPVHVNQKSTLRKSKSLTAVKHRERVLIMIMISQTGFKRCKPSGIRICKCIRNCSKNENSWRKKKRMLSQLPRFSARSIENVQRCGVADWKQVCRGNKIEHENLGRGNWNIDHRDVISILSEDDDERGRKTNERWVQGN